MMGTMRSERVALSATVSAERQAAMEALDKERAAIDADAARVASQVIADAGKQAAFWCVRRSCSPWPGTGDPRTAFRRGLLAGPGRRVK